LQIHLYPARPRRMSRFPEGLQAIVHRTQYPVQALVIQGLPCNRDLSVPGSLMSGHRDGGLTRA
jgi:hypothetical protein